MMRPASIQYRAGLPLNKKATAMMANAQTTDQTMGDATSFLEAGLIVNIVARLCRPSTVKSNSPLKMDAENGRKKIQIAAIAAKKDADIDLTDMPEVLDWSKAEIGKFYRPTKKPVTIRLDTDIVAWLKSYGRGYQTKTNMLLRHAMKSSVRAETEKLEK